MLSAETVAGESETETKRKYVEYVKHQSMRRQHVLSYNEWRQASSNLAVVNTDPHVFSLPSLKKVAEHEAELPRC
jgi:hypothetical protein